ncbi:MAG TPA: hypothetical protein PKI61_00335 [bacterium]|nr:hypothetical protein [bacterium]HPT29490.1 hypothetical protein [bacterium]
MVFHFDTVEDLAGFTVENAKGGDPIKILTRASLTSDDLSFYKYLELISNIFLNKKLIQIDCVYQFLILIHKDLSADLYINDFGIAVEVRTKRSVEAGEVVTLDDIADIRKVKFSDIEIKDSDKVIYCFKVGWRFGLFFDLTQRLQPAGITQPVATEKLDIEKMYVSIGDLRRYLSFYHIYKALESKEQFDEMMKDGWFPFVEIIAGEYKNLRELYQNKFDFENRIKTIVDSFVDKRIQRITEKWWKNQIFSDKKSLIEAGVNAYLRNNQEGFVHCINTLYPQVEGILRKLYQAETGKGNGVKSPELISYIIKKAKIKSGSDYSLLLPLPFLEYLKDVVFSNFNIETGKTEMSRNTSGHGIAEVNQYTKERALQLILILDQIYFYT